MRLTSHIRWEVFLTEGQNCVVYVDCFFGQVVV